MTLDQRANYKQGSTPDPDELLHQLDQAFGSLELPADTNIVYDNSGNHLECNQVRRRFRGRHWRSFSVAELAEEAEAMAFFTPEAFRFFLPAFVRASIQDYMGSDLIPHRILWGLTPPKDTGSSDSSTPSSHDSGLLSIASKVVAASVSDPDDSIQSRARQRRELLTRSQKKVLLSYTDYLRRHHPGDFRLGELDLVERALRTPS